jgi:hypothetical protein
VLALALGIPMGVYSALRRGSFLSQVFMTLSLLGVSLPTFLIGILLILLFSVGLGWFPSFGRGETVQLGWWSSGLLTPGWLAPCDPPRGHAGDFPAHPDHATGARPRCSKCCAPITSSSHGPAACPIAPIHFGHALKNTLVPVMTITGLQLGGLIAFAIITETVFQWPGMGLLFIQAVTFADVPVMAAYLCLIALIFVVINLVVDLLYFVVDPRLRVSGWSLMLAPRYRVNGRAFARIAELHPELTAFRRDLHAHPELGFEEVYTAARVAGALKASGVDEVHTGIGKTGVVGVIPWPGTTAAHGFAMPPGRPKPSACEPTWMRCP